MIGLTIKKTVHPVYRTDNDIDIIKNEDEIAMTEKMKGSFTLPGESGYEDLTLKMAKKWGADVIRDSDGTQLSPEILEAGYDIYSTVCIIRGHNDWIKKHPSNMQQSFLQSMPKIAEGDFLTIHLLDGYFAEQFDVNQSKESVERWQVFDRTTNTEVPKRLWNYEKELDHVVIKTTEPFHEYTVNFLAYRKWEEINMYNHVTNNWTSEHLIPVDPRSKEAQDYLYQWMDKWCKDHPLTNVVRFTSMFYNFVWIWGSDEKDRNLYTDWGSYDFTVSPLALDEFKKQYGYELTSEDFINKGSNHPTHMPPTKKLLDYMDFTNQFVVSYGKKLVELVHSYGKKAYVFYDDSWVGIEPYGKRFEEFGFDGLIKCVFSGYEARLCAGAKADTHELRLHPYLFPTGLGGAPTFSEGGNPAFDAAVYWNRVRRALLREPVDRIGLGGYLHLVENEPEFNDYIEKVADEFRLIKSFHAEGKPYTLGYKVAVLHSWGHLRSWTLSGHFHETYMHDLIHINEALSGLPVDVKFIDFQDVIDGALDDVDILINAGRAGDAWSGGDNWADDRVISLIFRWAGEGGIFIGVNEPAALYGYKNFLRLAPVLGIDIDKGAKACHGRWQFDVENIDGLIPEGAGVRGKKFVFITDGKCKVLAKDGDLPTISIHDFGKGKGIYLSSFQVTNENTRLLLNLMLYAKGDLGKALYLTDTADTECAYYPNAKRLVVMNETDRDTETSIKTSDGDIHVALKPFETQIHELS